MHGLARTIKEMVETRAGLSLPQKHPVLAWLIEHAGTLLTFFGRGDPQDGRTPYHCLKGKPWRIPLPAFGEKVEYRRRTRHKLETRWATRHFPRRPTLHVGTDCW